MGILSKLLGNAGIIEPEKLTEKYGKLLGQEEQFEVGFKVFRDTFLFTNRRLILIDVQGMTGRKVEYRIIPYSKITQYTIETSGHFDLDAELKIWVGSNPEPIEKKFNKEVNVYDVQRVMASYIR